MKLFWQPLFAFILLQALASTAIAQTSLTPSSLSFGSVVAGETSSAQTATFKNTQSVPLTISSIATSGGTAPSDYGLGTNCPTGPNTLAAGQSCTISVTFAPSALGARTSSLRITDNASNSPQSISLTGTGTTPLALSANNRVFIARMVGTTSGKQSVTLTNNFNAALSISLSTSGDFAVASNTCASSLASRLQCTVGVTFTPTALGARQGTLAISYNGVASPALVALSGTGNETVLSSISVTPVNPSIGAGGKQQFTATGYLTTGGTENLTPYVTWNSFAPAVANIAAGGLATAVSNGSSQISATLGTVSGSTTATVTAPGPVSITVTPSSPSIAAGGTQQFTAMANYSNGSQQNVTSTAAWSSSTPGVAAITSAGLATGVTTGNSGSTTVNACVASVCGSTTLTVAAAMLVSISVTPANGTVTVGSTLQFAATGQYSDESTQDLTVSATWRSSAPGAATITTGGLASGVATGNPTINATLGSIVGSTALTVNPATQPSAAASDWLNFLGDGSEGAYSCTSGTCPLSGEHWFSSFYISGGATVAASATNTPIVIRSTGSCTVAGTISNSPNSSSGGNTAGDGDFGAGGGGGGGGTLRGLYGHEGVGDALIEIINGGPYGAAGGGNGGTGSAPATGQYHMLLSGGSFWPVGGAVGGVGGSSGGAGGYGGGVVVLACNSISFTGSIDVSGGPGRASPASNSGAGGGGGSGYVIFSASSYSANTGTINIAGGSGGSCNSNSGCGNGGSGGNGWNKAVTIP